MLTANSCFAPQRVKHSLARPVLHLWMRTTLCLWHHILRPTFPCRQSKTNGDPPAHKSLLQSPLSGSQKLSKLTAVSNEKEPHVLYGFLLVIRASYHRKILATVLKRVKFSENSSQWHKINFIPVSTHKVRTAKMQAFMTREINKKGDMVRKKFPHSINIGPCLINWNVMLPCLEGTGICGFVGRWAAAIWKQLHFSTCVNVKKMLKVHGKPFMCVTLWTIKAAYAESATDRQVHSCDRASQKQRSRDEATQ